MSEFKQYPSPAVATDIVILGYDDNKLHVLLGKRAEEPSKDEFVLPGRIFKMGKDTSLEQSAMKVFVEKISGITPNTLYQLFSDYSAARDTRGAVVSVAYLYPMRKCDVSVAEGSSFSELRWFDIDDPQTLQLGLGHAQIFEKAKEWMKTQIYFRPIAFDFLNEQFTMTELQRIYEIILQTTFDRRNFQKKMVSESVNIVVPTGLKRTGIQSRPATLYKFSKERYNQFKNSPTGPVVEF
ncbi:MAG: hypothetical protein MJZ67_05195 [Bacteroidales bacterium]|nr:hypothetical protein [Bacteroidales bacterium]